MSDHENKPSDTIVMRGTCFSFGDYCEVYELYSEESDFRSFFSEPSAYEEHAEYFQSKENRFVGLEIIEEAVNEDVAEVICIEEFEDLTQTPPQTIRYKTRSVLVYEDDVWKIFREDREILI